MRMYAVLFSITILFCGCTSISTKLFSEDTRPYDFGKSRWGYSPKQVELIMHQQQGATPIMRRSDVIIYSVSINGVPALCVYTFKDKKLRTAGYMTRGAVKGKEKHRFSKLSVSKYGEPTKDNYAGMVWKTPDYRTIIFANDYISDIKTNPSEYTMKTSGGVLSHLQLNLPKTHPGTIVRWDGVWTYIDRQFYNELHEIEFPLLELSFYEKVLFGIIEKRLLLQRCGY